MRIDKLVLVLCVFTFLVGFSHHLITYLDLELSYALSSDGSLVGFMGIMTILLMLILGVRSKRSGAKAESIPSQHWRYVLAVFLVCYSLAVGVFAFEQHGSPRRTETGYVLVDNGLRMFGPVVESSSKPITQKEFLLIDARLKRMPSAFLMLVSWVVLLSAWERLEEQPLE